eukprot:CAMPEP_0172487988 /NCGR_PEP_ID=MMETSP1066-20121228/17333_1 /TAXON_ID=671091 /ORGANISM="Coscinodiscus wailesii, Strain CCMP2513" /LENGTH=58 /DNA_ID=CAMNT_0013254947 /DNA_START=33 /DNA_END=206 /DNA_ORIENTATION=+
MTKKNATPSSSSKKDATPTTPRRGRRKSTLTPKTFPAEDEIMSINSDNDEEEKEEEKD